MGQLAAFTRARWHQCAHRCCWARQVVKSLGSWGEDRKRQRIKCSFRAASGTRKCKSELVRQDPTRPHSTARLGTSAAHQPRHATPSQQLSGPQLFSFKVPSVIHQLVLFRRTRRGGQEIHGTRRERAWRASAWETPASETVASGHTRECEGDCRHRRGFKPRRRRTKNLIPAFILPALKFSDWTPEHTQAHTPVHHRRGRERGGRGGGSAAGRRAGAGCWRGEGRREEEGERRGQRGCQGIARRWVARG